VEVSLIEPIAKLAARLIPQLLDGELADLVTQGLPRPDDVTIDLDLDVVLCLAAVGVEIVTATSR
jgi:hypothetical protein